METRAAAVALGDLVPVTGAEEPGRVVHGPDGPLSRTGPLHAMAKEATGCGLAETEVVVLRQHFVPDSPEACPGCAAG